ncbi:DEKNAAC104756 [Brettanomyces naardenensis]|uniref:DEKNAAC104756 n=1 Tax=Brettanomyces naardenensis TaxID=13370 RepID=A0A448YRQ3_BRENA|nr:DEKNAAC104756 [Brettanomyces naardenensis]
MSFRKASDPKRSGSVSKSKSGTVSDSAIVSSDDESALTFEDDMRTPGKSNAAPTSSALPFKSRSHRGSSIRGRHRDSKTLSEKARVLMKSKESHRTGGILLPPGGRKRSRSMSSGIATFNARLVKSLSRASSAGGASNGYDSDGGVGSTNEGLDASGASDSESESDVDSHASGDSQETEEDVCFPMAPKHVCVGDVDVDELQEFIREQRQENQEILKRERGIRFRADAVATGSQNFSTAALRYAPKDPEDSGVSTTKESSSASDIQNPSSDKEGDSSGSSPTYPEPEEFFTQENDNVAPPNRFSFFNSQRKETIHAPDIPSLLSPGETAVDLFEPEDSVWWLDCTCPTDEEMKLVAKAFGIHPLTAEDIRTQEAREKVELFKTYYFVCFHTFEDDSENEDFLERINVYMVVFAQGMLTFHFSPISNPVNVRRRVRQLQDYFVVSSDWLCYAMIDDITDGFGPVIASIEYEAEAIEDSVFVLREQDFRGMLFHIGESRRKVMTLMRLLQGKADVIKMFAKRCQDDSAMPSVTSSQPVKPRADIALYLGDIQDHLITMFQSLLSYEKILSRAHMNYLAQLQVESFYYNNEVTDMLSKVTFLGTILVPMNLVTGLFGMNVLVPGKDVANYNWFGGILGFIVFVCVVSAGLGQWYMRRLSKKAEQPTSESIRSFKIGRHKHNEVAEDRRTFSSLPSKFSRYGDWQ